MRLLRTLPRLKKELERDFLPFHRCYSSSSELVVPLKSLQKDIDPLKFSLLVDTIPYLKHQSERDAINSYHFKKSKFDQLNIERDIIGLDTRRADEQTVITDIWLKYMKDHDMDGLHEQLEKFSKNPNVVWTHIFLISLENTEIFHSVIQFIRKYYANPQYKELFGQSLYSRFLSTAIYHQKFENIPEIYRLMSLMPPKNWNMVIRTIFLSNDKKAYQLIIYFLQTLSSSQRDAFIRSVLEICRDEVSDLALYSKYALYFLKNGWFPKNPIALTNWVEKLVEYKFRKQMAYLLEVLGKEANDKFNSSETSKHLMKLLVRCIGLQNQPLDNLKLFLEISDKNDYLLQEEFWFFVYTYCKQVDIKSLDEVASAYIDIFKSSKIYSAKCLRYNRDGEKFAEVFIEALDRNIVLDNRVYNVFLSIVASNGHVKDAFNLATDFIEKKPATLLNTLSSGFLKGLAKSESNHNLRYLKDFETFVRSKDEAYFFEQLSNHLIYVYARFNFLNESIDLLEDSLKLEKFSPDPLSLKLIVKKGLYLRTIERKKLLELCIRSYMKNSHSVYPTVWQDLIISMSYQHSFQEISDILLTVMGLIEKNSTLITPKNKSHNIRTIIDATMVKRIIYLGFYANEGRPWESLVLLKKLHEKGLPLHKQKVSRIVSSGIKSLYDLQGVTKSRWRKARSLVTVDKEQMIREFEREWKGIIDETKNKNGIEETNDISEEMEEHINSIPQQIIESLHDNDQKCI